MLLDGPGTDAEGRRWVIANVDPSRPKIYPPGVLLSDGDGRLLSRIDYRAPTIEWLRALGDVVGRTAPAPWREARPELARLESALHEGGIGTLRARLSDWLDERGAADADGAVWARLLLGSVAYREGHYVEAHDLWRAIFDEHPEHPLRHRARYHLYDQHFWPTRRHPDLEGAGDPIAPLDTRRQGPLSGSPWRLNELGMAFAPIPAGRFAMGGSPAAFARELPVHQVEISQDYWLSATPVTRNQWSAFEPGRWPESDRGGPNGELPATGIDFASAQAFCGFLCDQDGRRYRLPTEAEWERAARGGLEGLPWPWGSDPITPERCNYAESRPVRVATYPANPWGLYDMVGNTQEWTADCYAEDAYARRDSLSVDPQGPETGDEGLALRVVRGGLCGASMCQLMCRNSFRLGVFEQYSGGSIGVRILLEAW